MKRGGPLRRKESLKRSSAPVSRKHLVTRPKKRQTAAESAASLAWFEYAIARGCEVCPGRGEKCEGKLQGHHMIDKAYLKDRGLHDLIWHHANAMGVCYKAHRRHTNRRQPIERRFLRREHFEFAEMYRLTHLLDRLYV